MLWSRGLGAAKPWASRVAAILGGSGGQGDAMGDNWAHAALAHGSNVASYSVGRGLQGHGRR